MRKLVEDEACDLGIGIADERREHRIGEIAKRRIGRHATHVHVIALGGKLRRFGARFFLREVASVIDAARDRKAPLPGGKRERRRREYVPQDESPVELGVSAVARVLGQPELAARIISDREHALEVALDDRVANLVEHRRDRLGADEQIDLARNALPVELRRRAAAEQKRGGESEQGERFHRPRRLHQGASEQAAARLLREAAARWYRRSVRASRVDSARSRCRA